MPSATHLPTANLQAGASSPSSARALSTFDRSPTASLYRRDAQLVYEPLEGGDERHHFVLSYPAGWMTRELEFRTDDLFFPHYASLTTRHGLVHYRLAELEVYDRSAFDSN